MNRSEFMAKVHRVMRPDDAEKVELAYLLAKKFHKGQVRKELDAEGNPLRYFEHLRRTALVLLNAGFDEWQLIVTALLHDSIEDSDESILVSTLIQNEFDSTVADWVRILSKTPESKDEYTDRLLEEVRQQSAPHFIIVKAADRLDNLRSLPDDPSFRSKQIKETKEKYLPIFSEFLVQSQSSVKIKRFKKVLKEIQEICETN